MGSVHPFWNLIPHDRGVSPYENIISDHRRKTLNSLFDGIAQCGNLPAEGIQKVKVALRLLQEEGLAYQFCVVTSDLIHAKARIQKAWKAACSSAGEDSEAAVEFKRYMKHPKTHPSWGKGRRMTLEGPDE